MTPASFSDSAQSIAASNAPAGPTVDPSISRSYRVGIFKGASFSCPPHNAILLKLEDNSETAISSNLRPPTLMIALLRPPIRMALPPHNTTPPQLSVV